MIRMPWKEFVEDMRWLYFIVKPGSVVESIIDDWMLKQGDFRAMACKLADEVGADDVYGQLRLAGPCVVAFRFDQASRAPRWMSKVVRPGYPEHCYEPDMRFPDGKLMMARMVDTRYREGCIAGICPEIGLQANYKVTFKRKVYYPKYGRYLTREGGHKDVLVIPAEPYRHFAGHESLQAIDEREFRSIEADHEYACNMHGSGRLFSCRQAA